VFRFAAAPRPPRRGSYRVGSIEKQPALKGRWSPVGVGVYAWVALIRLSRTVAVTGSAFSIAVAFGYGAANGAALKTQAERAVSPCGTATAPAWSPDGTQIAWFGYRWPRPPHGHAVGSFNILRAFCVSNADGKQLHQLPRTVCSESCSNNLGDPPGQLDWVGPNLLVYGSDDGVRTISIGQKPQLLARKGPDPYSIDVQGDRVATSDFASSCNSCPGPVKIFSVPSGAVVGLVGGKKLSNTEPSLSPDGTQVVFTRRPATDSGKPAIWTAGADGSHLQRLERQGSNPLWSPAGNLIAYLAPTGPARWAWRVVAPHGGASRTLLRNGPGTVFGWSPNGRWIAFPDSKGNLAVIDVTTGRVRRLLKLQLPYAPSSVVWSPNSQQLLAVWRPPAHSSCPSGLWRVPVDGAKPRLAHGC
jgi:WD40 repeat protein